MALRTPSAFGTFMSQAQAGAEKQKEAREKLKAPGEATKSALGSRASTGTQMVAATTGAQQAATQKVQETQTQATTDLVVDPTKLGTATVTAIGGTVKPPPAPTTPPTTQTAEEVTPPPVEYTGGLNATDESDKSGTLSTLGAAVDQGNVSSVENIITQLDTDITNISNEISRIDELLKASTAEDAQKLQAEKDRLTELRDTYIKKREEENLGQIADLSQAELDAEDQAILMAERGAGNVDKLSTAFGPRWDSKKYGALASQIYGKDVEALQGEASEALRESERAKLAADEADKQYVEQIDASKKAYEEKFKDEDRKTALLAMTPEELKGVTKEEVDKLFGKDMAEQLFDFNENGYVSNAQLSKTREILQKNIAAKKDLKTQAVTDKDKAQAKSNELFDARADSVLGTEDSPGILAEMDNKYTNFNHDRANDIITHIKDVKNSIWSKDWKDISKHAWLAEEALRVSNETKEYQKNLRSQMEAAKNSRDSKKFNDLKSEYERYTMDQDRKVEKILLEIPKFVWEGSGRKYKDRRSVQIQPTATDANPTV